MRRTIKKFWFKKTIKVNPYPSYLTIVFTNDLDKASNFINEKLDSLLGVTVDSGPNVSIIINPDTVTPLFHGVITHEAYHAAAYILDYVGEEYSWRSESAAYLIN